MRKVYVTVRECVSELPALSLSRPSSRHISCPGLLSTDISWYRLLYCLTCLVLKAFFLNCARTHIYRATHTHSRTHTRLGIQHCLRDSRATRNQFRTHPTHPHRQLSHSKFTSSGLPPIHPHLPTPHTHTPTSSHLSLFPLFSITAEAESRWFQVSASRTGTQRSYGALTFYLPLSQLPSSPHVPTLSSPPPLPPSPHTSPTASSPVPQHLLKAGFCSSQITASPNTARNRLPLLQGCAGEENTGQEAGFSVVPQEGQVTVPSKGGRRIGGGEGETMEELSVLRRQTFRKVTTD